MHHLNFTRVQKLMETAGRLQAAHADAVEVTEKFKDKSYSCCVSMYGDGSGPKINMTGCYVADRIAQAAASVIREKFHEVLTQLNELGVDTDQMTIECNI